jgi:hypothetical protein
LIQNKPKYLAISALHTTQWLSRSAASVDTIRAAMQDDKSEFSKEYKKGFSGMKMKLSEAQVKSAIEDRNPTLLVWLGKQYLGQKDVPDAPQDHNKPEICMRPARLAESDED